MYEELQVERYLVDYERVPITDEKSPKEMDFDILVSFHILNLNLNFMISNYKVPVRLGSRVIHFSFY